MQRLSDCIQTQDSLFYNAPGNTYLHIYLLADPTNENPSSTPIKLVLNLNVRRNEIQSFIPRLADGDFLQMGELLLNIPSWVINPSFITSSTDTISISVLF